MTITCAYSYLVKKPINREYPITNGKSCLINYPRFYYYSIQHLKYVHWGKGVQRQILPVPPPKADRISNNFN